MRRRPKPTEGTMIGNKEKALVHVGAAKLGLDDDARRDLMERVAGVRSSTDLDGDGFRAIMDEYARLGWVSSFAERGFGHRHRDMATYGQVQKIRHLWREVTDGEGTDKGLDTWIERRFKVSSLRFLPKEKASKVIAALIGWRTRKEQTAKVSAA